MLIMMGCSLLLLVAAGLTLRWRAGEVIWPVWTGRSDGRPTVGWLLQVYAWLICLGTLAGVLVGLLVVGPGGRLAMRILAATSPDAEGSVTDASEVVGRITLGGTAAFFVFVGVGAGVISGIVYVLLHRALPAGLLGGVLLGILLLVILGARVDPLRPDNQDFEILGPGWLAVVLFSALAVATGAFVAAATARLSHLSVPTGWAALLYVVPLLLFLLPVLLVAWPLACLVVAGGLVFVTLGRVPAPSIAKARRRVQVLRGGVAVLAIASLPAFVSAVMDIAP